MYNRLINYNNKIIVMRVPIIFLVEEKMFLCSSNSFDIVISYIVQENSWIRLDLSFKHEIGADVGAIVDEDYIYLSFKHEIGADVGA